MKQLFCAILCSVLCLSATGIRAQERPEVQLTPLTDQGWFEWEMDGLFRGHNGVLVRYGDRGVLTADEIVFNQKTSEAIADGKARLQQGEQVWVSEHLAYNFDTRQLVSERFRTGKSPVFASGRGLQGDFTNQVYVATNAYVTTEDIENPTFRIRAKRLTIIPGKKVIAHEAVLYAGDIPVFYFPVYV